MSLSYRHGRFNVNRYRFNVGGAGDVYIIDFVNDPAQGFKVPAKSLAVRNHGGGSGNNYLYMSIAQAVSSSGTDWDETTIVEADSVENYSPEDGCIMFGVLLWSSNPGLRFSLRATPGIWTQSEVKQYMASPVQLSTAEFSALDKEAILAELATGGI